mmetsp:Transcript_23200/g.31695  ORF Transcript_23200/g.31695 Transcript_23200/m.31695 type:complete len:805 (-) Transcript_23200:20-2434(-)
MSEGGEEKGVSWRSLILDFCFRKQTTSEELTEFLFGFQSLFPLGRLISTANRILAQLTSSSTVSVKFYSDRFRFFLTVLLDSEMKRDLTDQVKSRLITMTRTLEESLQSKRESSEDGQTHSQSIDSLLKEEIDSISWDGSEKQLSSTQSPHHGAKKEKRKERKRKKEKKEETIRVYTYAELREKLEKIVEVPELPTFGLVAQINLKQDKFDLGLLFDNAKSVQPIADTITYMTKSAMDCLKPSDLFIDKSQKLTFLANLFDKVSYWVATSCVVSKEPVKVVTIFINVATLLFETANYEMLLAILTGLGNVAVTRLSKVWAEVPSKKVQKYESLEQFMAPDGGYKTYREKLRVKEAQAPCVPYFALSLRDMSYIRDGSPTYVDNCDDLDADPPSPPLMKRSGTGSNPPPPREHTRDKKGGKGIGLQSLMSEEEQRNINAWKVNLLGKCVSKIFDVISVPYENVDPDQFLLHLITYCDTYDDDQLYRASMTQQPPPTDMSNFHLNPDFFSSCLIERGVSEETATKISEPLADMSLEELAALDRKKLKELGVTRLRDFVTILNAIHLAIGIPPFLLKSAYTWTNDDISEWLTRLNFDKGVIKKIKSSKLEGKTLMTLDDAKLAELVPSSKRKEFMEEIADLQEHAGLAFKLRAQIQKEMSQTSNMFTTFDQKKPQVSSEGSDGGRKTDVEIGSSERRSDLGGATFIHLNVQSKEIVKQLNSEGDSFRSAFPSEVTFFKFRMWSKKEFGVKMSLFGKNGDGSFFHILTDGELNDHLSNSKKIYLWDCPCPQKSTDKGCKCSGVQPKSK